MPKTLFIDSTPDIDAVWKRVHGPSDIPVKVNMENCRPRLYCASSSAFQLRNSESGFSRPVPFLGNSRKNWSS